MKVLSYYKFGLSLTLLTILLSCSQQKSDVQTEESNDNSPALLIKPISVISGKAYEEELLVATQKDPKRMGLYNAKKEVLLPIIYDEVFSGLVNPYYVVVVENGRQGLFDIKGKRICESIYDGFLLSPSDSSIIGAYLGSQEKWRIINHKGTRVFAEDYPQIQFLQKGLVVLQNENYKYSLASIKGTLMTKFEFEMLQGIEENKLEEKWYIENDIVAKAIVGMETIYINSKGKTIAK
ncbi:MAG: hypothetical protein AB8G15_22020 [Saprospiraceae bacterium]